MLIKEVQRVIENSSIPSSVAKENPDILGKKSLFFRPPNKNKQTKTEQKSVSLSLE